MGHSGDGVSTFIDADQSCQHAGWDEIARLKDLLEEDSDALGGRCEVLPLHSMVPSADQRRVFKHSLPGERKVIP